MEGELIGVVARGNAIWCVCGNEGGEWMGWAGGRKGEGEVAMVVAKGKGDVIGLLWGHK